MLLPRYSGGPGSDLVVLLGGPFDYSTVRLGIPRCIRRIATPTGLFERVAWPDGDLVRLDDGSVVYLYVG